MTAIACALLGALGFYFSIGLGDQAWLVWLAPIPILWLAFGHARSSAVFCTAWAAYALGECSLLRAYAGVLPEFVLVLSIGGPALLFAASVIGARRVQRVIGAIPALFAFAALWAGLDFLSAFNRSGGAIATPAAAAVGLPLLIQTASLAGFAGITFLIGAVSAGLALGLRTRRIAPAAIAVALFALNAGYGAWRMSKPPSAQLRVALVESNDSVGRVQRLDRAAALKAIDAYAARIARLRGVQLVVLPENIARIGAAWRGEAQSVLAGAASASHATIVAGFNTDADGAQHNVSWAFVPGVQTPFSYAKRRLVPVLETSVFTPGPGPKALADGTGLEICKDMDFPAMIRADSMATRPRLFAVPAWDFDADDWSHARVAVLRSVENGVPMARNAREGLLTVNDRYGRLIASSSTTGGFRTVIADLPLDGRGGDTLYDRLGDSFGWLCIAAGASLVAAALFRARKAR
jgi:apolipoprotein N-acyltransferase